MKLPLLFLLAMATPILLGATLLVPLYAGMLAAAYIIYMPESGAHPLAARLMDVFYIIETYGQLAGYWLKNIGVLGLVEYALPLVGLPLLLGGLGVWMTIKLSKRLLDWFHMSASV